MLEAGDQTHVLHRPGGRERGEAVRVLAGVCEQDVARPEPGSRRLFEQAVVDPFSRMVLSALAELFRSEA